MLGGRQPLTCRLNESAGIGKKFACIIMRLNFCAPRDGQKEIFNWKAKKAHIEKCCLEQRFVRQVLGGGEGEYYPPQPTPANPFPHHCPLSHPFASSWPSFREEWRNRASTPPPAYHPSLPPLLPPPPPPPPVSTAIYIIFLNDEAKFE